MGRDGGVTLPVDLAPGVLISRAKPLAAGIVSDALASLGLRALAGVAFAAAQLEPAAWALPRPVAPFHLGAAAQTTLSGGGPLHGGTA